MVLIKVQIRSTFLLKAIESCNNWINNILPPKKSVQTHYC